MEKFPPMTSCPFCDVIIRFDDAFPSNGNPDPVSRCSNASKALRSIAAHSPYHVY